MPGRLVLLPRSVDCVRSHGSTIPPSPLRDRPLAVLRRRLVVAGRVRASRPVRSLGHRIRLRRFSGSPRCNAANCLADVPGSAVEPTRARALAGLVTDHPPDHRRIVDLGLSAPRSPPNAPPAPSHRRPIPLADEKTRYRKPRISAGPPCLPLVALRSRPFTFVTFRGRTCPLEPTANGGVKKAHFLRPPGEIGHLHSAQSYLPRSVPSDKRDLDSLASLRGFS